MKIANSMKVLGVIVAVATCESRLAQAEEYRVVSADTVGICQAGTKTDWMVLEGPDDVSVARADSDRTNVAVCVSDQSRSAVNVQWKANGYWKSSGNISNGCAEILGASKVKVGAVETNFHQTATYYTCVQE